MESIKKLSRQQKVVLEVIKLHGPLIKTYTDESTEESYNLPGGSSIDKRIIKSLLRHNKLVPQHDGLFGDSQTYTAA